MPYEKTGMLHGEARGPLAAGHGLKAQRRLWRLGADG